MQSLDYEGVKKEAKYYCPQFQDYLIYDSCKSVHQKISATRKHQVVSGSLMPTKLEDKSNEDMKSRVQCGKDITVYCKDDNEAICSDCKTLKHRNCSSSTIEEAFVSLDTADRNSTKERMKALKAKLEMLQMKRKEDTENQDERVSGHCDKVEERTHEKD